MEKRLFSFSFSFLFMTAIFSQTITFEDGTTVNVNSVDFSYLTIRKASLGFLFAADGASGMKLAGGSYLSPEHFHIAATVGQSSISLEGSIFFTGRTIEKEKNSG